MLKLRFNQEREGGVERFLYEAEAQLSDKGLFFDIVKMMFVN
jgi:hypothetical protein